MTNDLKYLYAVDSDTNEFTYIRDAKKERTYHYRIKGMIGTLINAFDGEIRQKHWKAKEYQTPESIYHFNCIGEIAAAKEITYQGIIVKAHSVIWEDTDKFFDKFIKDYPYKPDLIFFDEDGKFLCIVDVKNPHRMIEPDYNKYKQNSFTIEYASDYSYQQIGITQNFKFTSIDNAESRVRDNQQRIDATANEISRIKHQIKTIETRRDSGYKDVARSPKQREHEQRVASLKESIDRRNQDIRKLREM